MAFLIYNFLIVILALLSVPVLLLSLEIISALFCHKNKSNDPKKTKILAILMPAHNEELIIGNTIEKLEERLGKWGGSARLVVIADNCEDKTVEIAKATSAEVITRTDTENRGKGFALAYGMQHLQADPPEIVMIVDADCQLEDGAIESLIDTVCRYNLPAQALYLLHPNNQNSVGQQVSAFAVVLKNHVRALGTKAMGIPCPLFGTGMAFPWDQINEANLGNSNIVEDMKLGMDLVASDAGPVFCPNARVNSQFPTTTSALTEQRLRWEHGHMQIILSAFPKLALKSLMRLKWKHLLYALDIAIPPLSLLVYLLFGLLIVTGVFAILGHGAGLFSAALGLALLFFSSVLVAWAMFGREVLPASSLIAIPFYIISKLFIYLKFFQKRQKEWVRTDRN